jgi:hypothetical protein
LRWINIAVVLLPMLLQLIIWGLFLFVVTRLAFSGYWRTHLEHMRPTLSGMYEATPSEG